MRPFAAHFRLISLAVFLLLIVVAPHILAAQTVSITPIDLSFGIPTGSQPRTATQVVTVNIAGAGSVSLSNFAITGGQYAGDFSFNGNACTTPQTAPATCTIGVQFNSQNAAGVLETATLSFTSSTQAGAITVPLNGAYGAIELLGAFNINLSLFSGVTWAQNPPYAGQTVQSANINLSCPAATTAALSSTPDGSGNLFQDNTMQFMDTVGTSTTTTTDVCTGGDPNFQGFTGFPAGATNCFQPSYEGAVTNYVGQSPDLATYPMNGGAPGSFLATYGIPPLNVASLLTPGTGNSSQVQSVSVQLQDAGGYLGASTLHLVTNCSLAGVTPGATVTGNPISTSDPSSLTQTYTVDSAPGQDISVVDGNALNPPPNGVVPSITDIGVPQALFNQLVAGTSAAPSVCFRMAGELDSLGNPMCKGFFLQCTDIASGTTSGDNCDPTTPSGARLLYDALQFATPDGPVNGYNFLYGPVGNPAADACSFALTGVASAACAIGTGPGILMGSDNWLCAPGETAPCTPLEPNTSTTGVVYSSANCSLTGSLTGDLCPLNTLTNFKGAADLAGSGTTSGKNSILVPVANMPLPSTAITNTNFQSNGWVSPPSSTAKLTFTANPASYSPSNLNPPANSFAAASAYAVTYGFTAASTPLPDTTYPVAGDVTLFNPTANANFGTPFCSSSTTPSFSPPAVSVTAPGDGIYNLHYFTTDCALTEELLFNPQGTQLTDPTANWASFRYTTFGVDTVAPTSSCSSPSTSTWYKTNQTVSCTVTDQNYVATVSGSGFLPLVGPIQGSKTEAVSVSTNVAPGGVNSAASTAPLQACDLAGNCVSVSAGPFMIDLQPPTVSGPTFSSAGPYYTNSPAVTVAYSCSDGTGSGVASCGGTQTLSGGSPVTIASGGALNFSVAGSYTLTVTATDNAGNTTTASTPFTVTAVTPQITIQLGPTNPVALSVNGSVYDLTLILTNTGNTTASTVTVKTATLGSSSKPTFTSGNPVTNLAPGATGTVHMTFPASAGAAGKSVPFSVNGTYSGGSLTGNWSISVRSVTLP